MYWEVTNFSYYKINVLFKNEMKWNQTFLLLRQDKPVSLDLDTITINIQVFHVINKWMLFSGLSSEIRVCL
jgi:hypothetical protein